MKFTCVDPVEFLYPDVTVYKSGTDMISILTPRGSYACAQILFYEGEGSLQIACEGWEPEVYEMVAIPVETNERMTEENSTPFSPAGTGVGDGVGITTSCVTALFTDTCTAPLCILSSVSAVKT